MAIAFPPEFFTGVGHGGETSGREWRLAPDRIQDLRDVAMGIEEGRSGVCCRYLIDHIAGGGGNEVDDDGYVHRLADLEKFVDRFVDWGKHEVVRDWRNRIARCRRAMTRLRNAGDHRSADVLMVAYGHPDPAAAHLVAILGRDLAPLARYVDLVEAKRQEMVREEARRAVGGVVDMGLYRAKLARADRILTSMDALSAAVAPCVEPAAARGPDEGVLAFEARKVARRERLDAHKDRVEGFLREIRGEAREMLVGAERKYWVAWLASASECP
jgi:hypothetical protein